MGRSRNAPGGATERSADHGDERDDATVPIDELLRALGTSSEGLSDAEAGRRLDADGPNAIEEHRRSPVLELLTRYWGPIPWMIEVALALSIAVGHWADAVIIGALLVMNGIVSFWEEHQAGNAIEALKEHLATTARVVPRRHLAGRSGPRAGAR